MTEVVKRIDIELRRRDLKRSAIASCGIDPSTLSHWQKGRLPSVLTVYKLSVFLGMSMEWILTGKEASDLGQDEKELLRLFGGLDGRDRTTLLELARSLASRYGSSSAVAVHPAG